MWGRSRTQRIVCCFVVTVAVCLVAVSSAAEPTLRKTVVVPLRLSADYIPPGFPPKPLDDRLRVGVLLPTFDRDRAASWTSPAKWTGQQNLFEPIPSESITEVDKVIVDAAAPLGAALPNIVRRIFPRAEILTTRHCATCDLIFDVDVKSDETTDGQRQLTGVNVDLTVTVLTRNVVQVTSLSASGFGKRTKLVYWSDHTLARGLGEPALRSALDRVFAKIMMDPALRQFIESKATERARPSDLQTTVAFDDTGSFLPNGRLDAGERARLRFTIRNVGAGPAFAVRLRLSISDAAVKAPGDIQVGPIAAGAVRQLEATIQSDVGVDSGRPEVRVETVEQRGYGGRPVILHLVTERLRPPTLEIADFRLEDRGTRAHGDGDGRVSNNETLEAVVFIRNSGPGEAVGAAVMISSTPGVEVVDSPIQLDAIPVNGMKEVRSRVRLPARFDQPDLGLTVRAVETRGTAAGVVEVERRWPVHVKRPQVEVGFRLFDGNSPQSRGNRDGIANNGELLEVALIARNRGALAARGVRLSLTSTLPNVTVKPLTIDIGELPSFAEAAEQRIQLTLPRTVGHPEAVQRIPLNVAITQSDFPATDQAIAMPFQRLHPDLIPTVANQTPLVEGKEALFALEIQNAGDLSAEEVSVDVTCDNPAVELLDAAGAPVRTVRIKLGSIPARMAAARIQLKAHVRRNIAALAGSLKVAVSQRDYMPVSAHAALQISREEPALITAVPPPVDEPRFVTRSMTVPATISFQRFRDGSRLAEDAVVLAFEVQSQTPVEIVRLEQNRRVIDLPKAAPIHRGGIYLWQYEPVVHLDYGENEFEVIVITSDGIRNSRSMTLHREKPRGKIWLAVIGVSNYREPAITDLQFAKEDAVAVRSYYRQLGIPDEQIIELLDANATLANVKRSLGTDLMRRAINPDDTVLIYFAGHGQMEADRSSADADGYSKYLLPHDANPADLFGSALSMEELSRILQRLRSERVVLIIDSCFSGAAGGRTPFEPNAPSRGVITEEFLSRIANVGRGRVILTASGSREVAQESREARHGIFTYFLLEGLRGAADSDQDGQVDIDEIYKFVSQKVSSATRGRQNPMRKAPNLTGMLVIGGRLE